MSQMTLSSFLEDENTQIRVFDMGRRVSKIALSDFKKFEQSACAYPYPFQQTAWVGLLFWNSKDKSQHNIWFLRMPLDERGFINLASRDEFMDMVLSRIGERITAQQTGNESLTHALKDNPYVFKPTEENMAVFHAKAKMILSEPPSSFYDDTVAYFSGKDFENWQHLGIQGFADFAVRQSEKDINQMLCSTLKKIPEEPFSAICNALENEACSVEFYKQLAYMADSSLESDEPEVVNKLVSLIRPLANAPKKTQIKILTSILNSPFGTEPGILVMIVAKAWEALEDPALLSLYIEKLANNSNGQVLFNALMTDQMFMPGKRDLILQVFRDPERSEAVSTAVGGFFQVVSANQ